METPVDSLNERFGIPGVAQVESGNGGLAVVRVTAPEATAAIYLHGAQVTAWRPSGAEEVLFLSQQSRWEDGRAIRGGIPICFPWFRGKADNPKAPAHGLVRTRAWQLDGITWDDGRVTVVLSLASDEGTLAWWPHAFKVTYRVSVGTTLQLELTVTNTGEGAFSFEEALHTYFKLAEVTDVRITGLEGTSYLDNTDSNLEKEQKGAIVFTRPMDSAYLHTGAPLTIVDAGMHRSLCTIKDNSHTTVVWNPWQQGAASLADLGDEEWRQMACVEASNILADAIELAAGASHTIGATLEVVKDSTT